MNNAKNSNLFLSIVLVLLSITCLVGLIYNHKEIISLQKSVNLANLSIKTNNDNINNLFNINDYNQNKINIIESQINQISSATKDFSLLQINELIGLANQFLLIYGDVTSTIKILNYINKLLENNNHVEYMPLKLAINNDIASLLTLEKFNLYNVSTKVNLLSNTINALPFNIELDKKNHSTNISPPINNLTILQKFWLNIKEDIKKIFIVSRLSYKNEIETLPEQEVIIRQNVLVNILSLKVALLQGDNQLWHYYLNDIKTNLITYFVKNENTNSLISLIAELDQININIHYDLKNTNDALFKLNKQT